MRCYPVLCNSSDPWVAGRKLKNGGSKRIRIVSVVCSPPWVDMFLCPLIELPHLLRECKHCLYVGIWYSMQPHSWLCPLCISASGNVNREAHFCLLWCRTERDPAFCLCCCVIQWCSVGIVSVGWPLSDEQHTSKKNAQAIYVLRSNVLVPLVRCLVLSTKWQALG